MEAETDPIQQAINTAAIDEAEKIRRDWAEELAVRISNARVRSMKG